MSSETTQPPASLHRSKARGKPYFRTPVISPKGDYVAFVYAGDIWLVETNGGFAECLATHYAAQMSPRFSPDGSLLAFSSNRTGHGDIYVLALSNGEVQRLTYTDSYCNVEDWAADGQSLYFTADREGQGDAIYRVPLTGGTPILICAESYEELAHVTVSPSGEQLAFNNIYRAWWNRGPDAFAPCDLWLADLASLEPGSKEQTASFSLSDPCPLIKAPRRLFAADKQARGFHRWPMWDPDGSGLYFVSDQTGVENLWFQSFENSEPRQITHFSEGRLLWPAIAREKKLIVFEHDWQIWQLDLSSGEVKPIPINIRADTKAIPVYFETRSRGFSELNLAPDGEKVAFVARGKIFVDYADKETDKEQRQGYSFALTELVGSREHSVVWTPDSRSLLYISDRHGEDEIYRYDFATRSEIRLTNDFASKWSPKCSPDGQWLAFIRNLETIYLLDLKTNALRPLAQGNFLFSNGLAWSPDSRWLAYISHDHRFFSNVYLHSIDETESRQITFLSNIMGGDLHWAPNGEFLVFTSGQYRLESRIVRVDLRPPRPLLRETEFEKLFEDRPAKKRGSNGGKKDEPEPENLNSSPEAELASPNKPPNEAKEEPEEPAESAEKGPSEVEKEEKKPKQAVEPVEIVFEGIERRLRFLTPIQMDASVETISPDSRDLLFLATVADKVNIWMMALDEPRRDQPLRQLTSSGDDKNCVQFVPNGKKFFALEDGQIVIRKFPQASDSTNLQVRSEVMIDFHQDKSQVFNEAWRLLRDTFYDPTFQGQDWNALREQFIPLIDGAQTKNDLRLVINLMVGELRASHLGTYYYGAGGQSQTNDGYTGLLFDPVEQAERGFLRITGLIPDSPVALLPDPPKLGEYLVAVNGNPLTPQSNLDQCLQRTAGRRVVLRLAPTPLIANETPEADETQLKPRELAIRPIDSNTYSRLRYRAWVAANKAYVQRISADRLGYVHVADMSYAAYQQFLVDLDTENYRKDGIILDIRYNRGGHIATFIMDVLTRCSVLLSGFRDRLTTNSYHYSGNRALNKPTVLVTNERSASNAEIFTEMYRRLGLGKIVGQSTAGAVIGTIDWPLVNGLFCRLPLYAIRTPEGENLEGKGRAVDVEVAQQLGEGSLGRDQQLATAVATLLADLGIQA